MLKPKKQELTASRIHENRRNSCRVGEVGVAALALGVTVPAASRVLIPASRRAQRFTPSGAAATCPAVLLAPVAARADEHLAPASGTQKQSGIVHCTPRRGGLDDPRLPGNTALGAVRKCGSGRSLGRDHQVSTVRGCVSLLVDSDLTPTHERRHRRCARCACAMGRQHRLRRETTTRPKRARRDDSEQVRSDRSSQFTWPVRQITAHLRSHEHPFPLKSHCWLRVRPYRANRPRAVRGGPGNYARPLRTSDADRRFNEVKVSGHCFCSGSGTVWRGGSSDARTEPESSLSLKSGSLRRGSSPRPIGRLR